jgi:hypothetical protein
MGAGGQAEPAFAETLHRLAGRAPELRDLIAHVVHALAECERGGEADRAAAIKATIDVLSLEISLVASRKRLTDDQHFLARYRLLGALDPDLET